MRRLVIFVKPTTIRIFLILAVTYGQVICKLDVRNAFLYSDLLEDVYMTQPQGFVHPNFANHFCKLNKSFDGLKQASHAQFYKFNNYLLLLGSVSSLADSSMFILCKSNDLLILLLYVNDIIFIGSTPSLLHHIIRFLSTQFSMKDLGDLHYFLGLQVVWTPNMLFLSESKYVQDLLTKFHIHKFKPVRAPLHSRIQ